MQMFNDMLLLAENNQSISYLTEKALTLADKAHARLTIMADLHNAQLVEQLTKAIEHYQQQRTPSYRYHDISAAKICFHDCEVTHKQVLAMLSEQSFDLIIKDRDIKHRTWGITKFDHAYLLQEAATHLLLVGQQPWQDKGYLLTALETEESTDKHLLVNHFVLEESQYVSQLLSSNLHLINCYQEQPGMSLADSLLQSGPHELSQQHWNHLHQCAAEYGIADNCIHIEAGLPEFTIPEQAEKYQADLVVMASGEHHGLLNYLRGHTANFLIQQLPCDALILKAQQAVYH